MRIYVGLLLIGFIGAMIAIICGGAPEQPLIWAAAVTASLVPVMRRYPDRGGVVLVAIALAELVLGLSVHVAASAR